jgi:hypothetical protein
VTATYDPLLSTDKDLVRFLIGDRDANSATLQDEEIDACLQQEANVYLAAAMAAGRIMTKGGAAVSKSVGNLSISYGGNAGSAYGDHVQKLREKGADLLLKESGSSTFRIL